MKKLIGIFCLLGFVSFNNPPKDNKKWIADFEKLKTEMVNGYSNLKFAREKERLNLKKLNEKTLLGLESAKSREEAQSVIREFLKSFNDGHLRARIYNVPGNTNIKTMSGSSALTNKDMAATALIKMAYEKREPKFTIHYDSVPGYEMLSTDENPFPSAIIEKQNHRIGVLRIGFFGYWRYWDTASNLWEEFRKSFDGDCDRECEWSFTQKVENKLTQLLIQNILELKSRNIDALVVDVSGNGGGTEWYEAVARLFSADKLIDPPFYFTNHAIWQNVLTNQLKLIDDDLNNTAIQVELRTSLRGHRKFIEGLLKNSIDHCETNQVWLNNDLNCLKLVHHPYAYRLPRDIMDHPQFMELRSKYILQTHRFMPYTRGVYDTSDRLFIVQDHRSGSATEGFTSILQSNGAAIIVGETSFGAGCGYTNGGFEVVLENIGLAVKMPDCVRLRNDGKNEFLGINPDIPIHWSKDNSSFQKGNMVIESIWDYVRN